MVTTIARIQRVNKKNVAQYKIYNLISESQKHVSKNRFFTDSIQLNQESLFCDDTKIIKTL